MAAADIQRAEPHCMVAFLLRISHRPWALNDCPTTLPSGYPGDHASSQRQQSSEFGGPYQAVAPLPHMLLQPPTHHRQRSVSLPNNTTRPAASYAELNGYGQPQHMSGQIMYGSPPHGWSGFGPMQNGQYMQPGSSGHFPPAMHPPQSLMMLPHFMPGQMAGPPFLLPVGPGSPPQGVQALQAVLCASSVMCPFCFVICQCHAWTAVWQSSVGLV